MLKQPLTPTVAKALIVEIVATGAVVLGSHAAKEMDADDLQMGDVLNVLKGGIVEPAELVKGSWRYRVRTARIYVVVAFWSAVKLIVTAWRKKTK